MSIPSVSEPAPGDDDFKKARRKKPSERTTVLDRLPPASAEAEMGVLGCIMLSPLECLPEAILALAIDDYEAFYDLRHRTIFDFMVKVNSTGTALDLITLQQALKDAQLLDQVGGIAYLSQLQDSVPSAANLAYYLGIVREKYLLRRMIQTCSGVVGRIYDWEGDVDDLLDETERAVLSVRNFRKMSGIKPIKDLVQQALTDIEFMVANPGKITGYTTGFEELDKEIDGFHPTDFIVLGAYPSVGKTSLAMNWAEHFVLTLDVPVGVFSAEMSGVSLVRRILCSQARVDLRGVRRGTAEVDTPALLKAAGKLAKSPLYIDDTSDMTVDTVRAKARRMVQQHQIKLFVIDYAQLFKSKDAESRTRELEEVSAGFKNMGKELGVPVVLLTQLNDDGKIKGARSIGADADLVLILKEADKRKEIEPGVIKISALIDKQRNGEQGITIPLHFHKPFTRFTDVPKIEAEDVPKPQPEQTQMESW